MSVHDEVMLVLRAAFPDSFVQVAGDEDYRHIEVSVASAMFANKDAVSCHRMVLTALSGMLNSGMLHAVSVNIKGDSALVGDSNG